MEIGSSWFMMMIEPRIAKRKVREINKGKPFEVKAQQLRFWDNLKY
jgi:hypothetical protein